MPVKRLEATARSPIFSHLTSTMQGLALIRCHGIQEHLATKMDQLLDAHGKLFMAAVALDRWLNIRVLLQASCFFVIVLYLSIYLRDALTPGVAALSIVYAIALIGYMQYSAMKVCHLGFGDGQSCNQHTLLQFVDVQSQMISVERILELSHLKHENNNEAIETNTHSPQRSSRPKLPPNWPQLGHIKLVNVSMRYRHDMPEVLRNVCLEIRAMEKVCHAVDMLQSYPVSFTSHRLALLVALGPASRHY